MPTPNSWVTQGLCRSTHPDLFFSEIPEDIRKAIAICSGCPVKVQCAEYANSNQEEFGVWGGINRAAQGQIIKHGTYTGYVRGCRLPCCAGAKRQYARDKRARDQASRV